VDAIARYGTQFSSSRAYLNTPLYTELEGLLDQITGAHTVVTSTTTLAHMAALPTLVHEDDAVLVDHQAHASIHNTTGMLKVRGTQVRLVRHNRLDQVERVMKRIAGRHRKVWYLADGIYSMYGDFAPMEGLTRLQERFSNLHLYIDDAHGLGWTGRHGRGHALEAVPLHERTVVVASMAKSFGVGGGIIVCPTAEQRERILTVGGPLVFGGPLQPPVLGAAVASARLHLSDEIHSLQARLMQRIDHCNQQLLARGLPLVSHDRIPIRFIGLGPVRVATALVDRLLEDGFWVNLAVYPAVPMKNAGLRLTLTNHLHIADIDAIASSIEQHLPEVLDQTDHSIAAIHATFGLSAPSVPAAAPRPRSLQLEHHRQIDALDAAEWDRLLGGRGIFDVATLKQLEATHQGEHPGEDWHFHYFVVRDPSGQPVLATFFTDALWKNDMLSAQEISLQVEAMRRDDPLHQTSRVLSMGSLLTEGDHLYLDRSGPWEEALRLLLDKVQATASDAGANMVVFRDLGADAEDVGQVLLGEGFARVPLPNSMVVPLEGDESDWLAALSKRQRQFIRSKVYPLRPAWRVEVCDAEHPTDADTLDHLYQLYLNVKNRALRLNTFPIPQTLLAQMMRTPGWELLLLHPTPDLAADLDGLPAAFGLCYRGRTNYAPLIAGLDYRFVESHGAYRQLLYQAVCRARTLGLSTVQLGMDAELEKRRVGARPSPIFMYFQLNDSFDMDALSNLVLTRSPRRGKRTPVAP